MYFKKDISHFNVFLNAQAEHDPTLSKHIKEMEMKRKANGKQVRGTYISHQFQNELIDLIGEFLEQCVRDGLKHCWFFSILADEYRCSAGKQQLALFFHNAWFDPIS